MIKGEKILNKWSKHYLSLKGKVLVWNSLVISLFIHASQPLDPPDFVFKELNKMLLSFLWKRKHSKLPLISLDKLTLNFKLGGLNLIRLEDHIQVLRVAKLKRYLEIGRWDVFTQLLNSTWSCPPSLSDFTPLIKFKDKSKRIRPCPVSPLYISPLWLSILKSWEKFSAYGTSWNLDLTNRKLNWTNKDLRAIHCYQRLKNKGTETNFINRNHPNVSCVPERWIWKNVWKAPANAKVNETFFLFLHRALSLPDRLHLKNPQDCSLCNQPLSLNHYHLFYKCPVAADALAKLYPSKIYSKQSFTFILTGGLLPKKDQVAHRSWMQAIWKLYVKKVFK